VSADPTVDPSEPVESGSKRKSRKRPLLILIVALATEALGLRRAGYPIAGNVVVRCRQGHLYTTIWVAGASVKSLRLGWARVQYCPIGRHWSLVTLVRRTDLTDDELEVADSHRDIRIP
jgi:hypothetical protein